MLTRDSVIGSAVPFGGIASARQARSLQRIPEQSQAHVWLLSWTEDTTGISLSSIFSLQELPSDLSSRGSQTSSQGVSGFRGLGSNSFRIPEDRTVALSPVTSITSSSQTKLGFEEAA